LSDPVGGTAKNKGRHPVKMADPAPADGGPEWTIERLRGNLQLMECALRLYGHPGLLAVAEAVLGVDFVPYTEVVFIKEPGLGPSVAWHQDGTTHWDAADWDQGAHGFNFMAQLCSSTAGNGVWVLPGSHKRGKADIRQLVADSGSERIAGAVPLLCGPGDVFICNRQLVHGSFANSSPDRRITLNAGFFPRHRVLNVSTTKLDGTAVTYDTAQIRERTRMIAIAADARQQRFPHEPRYRYAPLVDQEDDNRWNARSRETLVKDYNVGDLYI
jgi:ectoine hydroxylase-related dioxygenase (phytanoyl-CoA dioxygenase family)